MRAVPAQNRRRGGRPNSIVAFVEEAEARIAVRSDGAARLQIVGDVEADIRANLISVSSPVARALIGKYEGDVVQVQAPSGIREFEIVSIKYL